MDKETKMEKGMNLMDQEVSRRQFISGLGTGLIALGLTGCGIKLDFAQGLTPMISASKYLSFFINFLLPFGLVFQFVLSASMSDRSDCTSTAGTG